ncbi:hypothetical protein EDB81DRAFT_763281 [Dactylonectria macrodidyma]|uniref:Uncharacterized protein n=1 Tax=Dactylonectria macrodidyma TaxID=307937 RepID=A0A9P9E8H3_9HYPO|nr:hypothetical protein EDB81DRAFT_763281 [Dactylonectria macrodidyma]
MTRLGEREQEESERPQDGVKIFMDGCGTYLKANQRGASSLVPKSSLGGKREALFRRLAVVVAVVCVRVRASSLLSPDQDKRNGQEKWVWASCVCVCVSNYTRQARSCRPNDMRRTLAEDGALVSGSGKQELGFFAWRRPRQRWMPDGDRPGVGGGTETERGIGDWKFVDSNLTETTNGAPPPRTTRALDSGGSRLWFSTRLHTRLQLAGGDPGPVSRTTRQLMRGMREEEKRSSVAAAERKDGSERDQRQESRRWAGAGGVTDCDDDDDGDDLGDHREQETVLPGWAVKWWISDPRKHPSQQLEVVRSNLSEEFLYGSVIPTHGLSTRKADVGHPTIVTCHLLQE